MQVSSTDSPDQKDNNSKTPDGEEDWYKEKKKTGTPQSTTHDNYVEHKGARQFGVVTHTNNAL